MKPQLAGSERELKFSSGVDLILGAGITPEDEAIIRQKVDRHLEEKRKFEEANPEATYTLEVMFGKNRSMMDPYAGAVSFWERGALGGDGDTKIYICPGRKLKVNDCNGFIPAQSQSVPITTDSGKPMLASICPHCGKRWHPDDVIGEMLIKTTLQHWADVVVYWFVRLDLDADIKLKYHPSDIRSAAAREQAKQYMGELLNASRVQRAVELHTMRDIIKEASTGAQLRTCILHRLQ
jgi:hypothetical protein